MAKIFLGFCCGGAFTAVGIYLWAVWYFKDVYR